MGAESWNSWLSVRVLSIKVKVSLSVIIFEWIAKFSLFRRTQSSLDVQLQSRPRMMGNELIRCSGWIKAEF